MYLEKYFNSVSDMLHYYNLNIFSKTHPAGLVTLNKVLFPNSLENLSNKIFTFSAYVNYTRTPYSTNALEVIKSINSLYLSDGLSLDTVVPFLKEKGLYEEMINFCISVYNKGVEKDDPEYVTIDYFNEKSNKDILYSLLGCEVLFFSTGSGILLYNPTYYKYKNT